MLYGALLERKLDMPSAWLGEEPNASRTGLRGLGSIGHHADQEAEMTSPSGLRARGSAAVGAITRRVRARGSAARRVAESLGHASATSETVRPRAGSSKAARKAG